MIYVVFFVTLLLNSVKTSTDGGACNETWQKYSSNNYRWKAWWGGATDEVEEDTWIWESGKPLPLDSFVWGTGEPNNNNNQDYFCFIINDRSDPNFFGNDCRGVGFPLCQQERY